MFLERGLKQQEADLDRDAVMGDGSYTKLDREESKSDLSALTLQAGNCPHDD